MNGVQPRLTPSSAAARLTPRELQVLSLTAEGLTSKEIARHLGISPRTADVHRTHLIHKLGLRNRVEAVHYALTTGLLAVDRPRAVVQDGELEPARRTA
jgi:DNA-binding CsgD family transcriptional regulator